MQAKREQRKRELEAKQAKSPAKTVRGGGVRCHRGAIARRSFLFIDFFLLHSTSFWAPCFLFVSGGWFVWVGDLLGWLVGCFVGWSVGRSVCWLVSWLIG